MEQEKEDSPKAEEKEQAWILVPEAWKLALAFTDLALKSQGLTAKPAVDKFLSLIKSVDADVVAGLVE
jgi:hypothetical protein